MTSQPLKFSPAVWTTKTGVKIKVCDMGDHHLAATIALLRFKGCVTTKEYFRACKCEMGGLVKEMAILKAMEDELAKRLQAGSDVMD